MQLASPVHGVHSTRHQAPTRIDPTRVLGYAGAIALNACVLALLLAPLQAPPVESPPDRERITLLMPITPPRIAVPVTPPKPVQQPAKQVPAHPRSAPVETPPVPIVVEDGVLPVTVELPAIQPVQSALATTSIATDPPAPAAMRLEYAHAPPPPYPRADLRAGNEGTVVLQVVVDVAGRPLEVTVAESSGHRSLDAAARRHVLSAWQFRPAMRDGQPVEAVGLVPVSFSLR